jgi:hypothetical protein
MRFSVSVPVLSEPITAVLPSVSTAGSRRITAFRRAMRCTPSASVMVNTTGRPSGMAATASATATRNMSSTPSPSATPLPNATTEATPMAAPTTRAKRPIRCCNGVSVSPSARINPAIAPSSVASAVATTTPRPRPLVTTDPVKAMHTRSASDTPSSTGPVRFVTGSDSPVSSDSSTCSSLVSTSRRSAGTRLPDSSRTTSPGTNSRLSISDSRPSRTTRA